MYGTNNIMYYLGVNKVELLYLRVLPQWQLCTFFSESESIFQGEFIFSILEM